jgi:hypothetical protein
VLSRTLPFADVWSHRSRYSPTVWLPTSKTKPLFRFGSASVAATRAGSYEERTCSRCFEGRVYDMQRGAWIAYERRSDSARVVVYLYPKLKRRPR